MGITGDRQAQQITQFFFGNKFWKHRLFIFEFEMIKIPLD